jgi:hypothetical protein
MPKWLPKTRLYVSLDRFGLEGAAAVIEARVAELGGRPQQETVADRAARFSRRANLRTLQRNFLKNETGVHAAVNDFENFSVTLEATVSAMKATGVSLTTKRSNEFRIVSGIAPVNLIASFRPHYANVLDDAYLTLEIFKGFPRLPWLLRFNRGGN